MRTCLDVLKRQGVHHDVVTVVDQIAAVAPEWKEFLMRLKQRAQENIDAANEIIKNNS